MITQSRLTQLLQKRARQRRAPKRPRLPNQAERMYLGAMRTYAEVLVDVMGENIRAHGLHLDAPDRFKVRGAQERIPLDRIGAEVVSHGKRDAKRVLGLGSEDLSVGYHVPDWRANNVRLITQFTEQMFGQMDQLIAENYGLESATVADKIQGLFDMTRSRAELIARDQTLKLNGMVTQTAQRTAGIDRYVWSTSQDESVRDSHAELEGKTFSWDDPPVVNKYGDTGHPGDDYQCRCCALPVLPELEETA